MNSPLMRIGRWTWAVSVLIVAWCGLTSPSQADAQTHRAHATDSRSKVAANRRDPAVVALYSGDADRALRIASERLHRFPRDVQALVVAARAHLERAEYAPAYDLLTRALSVDSGNADVLYFLGAVSRELATQELDRLHAIAPDSPRVHQLLGRSFKLQDKLAEAVAEYELALRADPTLLQALLELAEIYRDEANCTEASTLYRRAEDVKPTYDGSYGLGACLAAQGEHAAAVQKFREALNHDRSSAVAYFGLGSSLLQLRDATGAVSALTRAVTLEPRMRQAYYLLGRAYAAIGQTERSRRALARAVELAKAERASDEAAFTKPPPRRAPQPPKERR